MARRSAGARLSSGLLTGYADDDLVLGYDMHGAVFGDVDDAAADPLTVR
jgi:hypothetical protein